MRLGIRVLPLTLLLFQGLVNKNTKNCQMGSKLSALLKVKLE